MNRKNAILATALGGLLALNVATQAQAAEDAGAKEKCYGVAKAGKNDCAANGHSCAGQAKADGHVDPTANPPDCARAVARSTATRNPDGCRLPGR